MTGNCDEIRQLISQGLDPNLKMTDWFDSEPLGWAASFNQLKAIITLIEMGADPLLPPNKAGETPLTDSLRERHGRVTAFLQEYEFRIRSLVTSGEYQSSR